MAHTTHLLEQSYPASAEHLPADVREVLSEVVSNPYAQLRFSGAIEDMIQRGLLPDYISDLVRVERVMMKAKQNEYRLAWQGDQPAPNPTLRLVKVAWTGLVELIKLGRQKAPQPKVGEELLLLWVHPVKRKVEIETASFADLLLLGALGDWLQTRSISATKDDTVPQRSSLFDRAAAQGTLIDPGLHVAKVAQGVRGAQWRWIVRGYAGSVKVNSSFTRQEGAVAADSLWDWFRHGVPE